MARSGEFQIHLLFDKRADGWYHVHSPSVPGLHLAGENLKALCEDVNPAVKDLLRENLNIQADEVRWIPSLEAVRQQFSEPVEGDNIYVVKVREAA
jgi:hypothetical protein